MAIDSAVKAEIIRRAFDESQDPKSIAVDLNITPPIAVYGVIRNEGVRRGVMQHPATAGAARKKKDDARPVAHAPSPEQRADTVDSPLFPNRPGNEIDRIEVERIVASPRRAGHGVLGSLDATADSTVIEDLYGGGRYRLKAFNGRGMLIASNVITIAGMSKPKDAEERGDDLTPLYYPPAQNQDALLAMVQQGADQQKQTQEMLTRILESRALEQRNVSEARAGEQNAFFQSMLATQQQAAQQAQQMMMQWFTLMQQSKPTGSGIKEVAEAMVAMKELFGDGGDSGAGDGMRLAAAALERGPEILREMKGMAMAEAARGNPPPSGGHPIPAVASAASPPPGPPDEAQQIARLQQMGLFIYHDLVRQGWSEKEAEIRTRELVGHYMGLRQQAQRMRRNGNGKAQPVVTPMSPEEEVAAQVRSEGP